MGISVLFILIEKILSYLCLCMAQCIYLYARTKLNMSLCKVFGTKLVEQKDQS